MEFAQIMVNWVESQVKSCLVPFFVKSFSIKPWHVMFGIFPIYYITYHDSMHNFSIFLNFFEPPFAEFQIYVKLAVPAIFAWWVVNPSLRLVLGSHTFREPLGIFCQNFGSVVYVPLVQI
jgi:hypothetical protein